MTANLKPLKLTRALWVTVENIQKHYDMIANILVKLQLAVLNPSYDSGVKFLSGSSSLSQSAFFQWMRLGSRAFQPKRTMVSAIDRWLERVTIQRRRLMKEEEAMALGLVLRKPMVKICLGTSWVLHFPLGLRTLCMRKTSTRRSFPFAGVKSSESDATIAQPFVDE